MKRTEILLPKLTSFPAAAWKEVYEIRHKIQAIKLREPREKQAQ
jgi:hypothetical protein